MAAEFYTNFAAPQQETMCIKQIIVKKTLTVVLLCLVVNVICDFSAFNFNTTFTVNKNIDLDNTYLESFLEGIFHKDIKLTNQSSSNKQSPSTFLCKLCPVVAFHELPAVCLSNNTSFSKTNYFETHKKFYTQSFIEINSPPPQA